MRLGHGKMEDVLVVSEITLQTDHQALTTLLSTKGADRAGMRIAR